MNTKYLLRRVGTLILAALLIPGIALISSSTTQAQVRRGRVIIVRPIRPWGWGNPYRNPYRSYYSQYVFSSSEAAEGQGYHDGVKVGSDDGRKGKSYDPERSHYFHDAGFGNFAEAYRAGFLHGYADGYRA
jgi:hypothetical protein